MVPHAELIYFISEALIDGMALRLVVGQDSDSVFPIDHQVRECPDECVYAVGRVGARVVRLPARHLVFELPEYANVMHSALLVERGDRLGTGPLPA
jgi:hypothetical protein